MIISDSHTHHEHRHGAIINWRPGMAIEPDLYYSAGTHPWNAGTDDAVDSLPESPRIVAVGEVGLDKAQGTPLDIQQKELLKWIEISENRELPLILHIVRAFPEIITLKKRLSPKQPWIIHGFRGKPQLASELLRHGFYLSIGEKYNPDAVAVIPRDRLLLESDEGTGIPLIENADPTLADKIFLKNLQSGGDGGEKP